MPPKRGLQGSKRKSTSKVSQNLIPIYLTLSNPNIRDPISDLIPQIQQSQNEPENLKISLLKMLIDFCGLTQFSSSTNIDPNDTTVSLQEIIEKAYQSKNTISTPIIVDTKLKFSSELIKRLRQFYQILLNDQMKIINDQKIQFNQSFLSWLEILTQVKIRIIRNAAIKITKIFVEEEIKYYQKLHQQRHSKKAFNVSKKIGYFLQKVISKRLNDIDSKIREAAFQATQKIFIDLESELLNQNILNKYLTPMFEQDIVIVQSTLSMIINLLHKCKKNNRLIAYLLQKKQKIEDISRNSNFTGSDALRIIGIIHHYNPEKNILHKNYLVNLLQTYAKQNSFSNIHTAIDVFYNSLYDTEQKLQQNSSSVLIQILDLLSGINNSKYLNLIFKLFFTSNRKIDSNKIFNIDNMFLLLMSQKYPNYQNENVDLTQNQIQLLLDIISSYIKHAAEQFFHLVKDKKVYQEILQKYNNHILIHCKQLFFQKMTNYKTFSQKYLRLFANIHLPTLNHGALQNYLTFVIEKSNLLFVSEVTNHAIFKQIVNIYHNLRKAEDSDLKYNIKNLIFKLNITQALDARIPLKAEQMYKITAILTRFSIYQLTTSSVFITKCIKFFVSSHESKQKIQTLLLAHLIHHRSFMDLIQAPSQRQAEIYKTVRKSILQFFLQILNGNNQSSIVKLSAFRGLTFVLKQVSNSKFQQLQRVKTAYQLQSEQMKIFYEYVQSQLGNGAHNSSLDKSSIQNLTSIFSSLSFEDHQIKTQILKLLFDLYQHSYVFACSPDSARFISFLIKGQMQLQKQAFNAKHLISIVQINRLIQRLLSKLLNHYFIQQLKPINQNKLVYWRLAYQILQVSRQDDKFDTILQKILTTYLSNKRPNSDITKRINNKLMIFTLTAVDKILQKKQYINLDIYQNILRRVSRRFPKQTLIRIKQYYLQKTSNIQSPYVNSFNQFLQSISKVIVKKQKKQSNGQNKSEQSSQQQSDNGQIQMKNPQQQKNISKKSKKQSTRMMQIEEDEQPIQQNKRNTRSQTKKKVK